MPRPPASRSRSPIPSDQYTLRGARGQRASVSPERVASGSSKSSGAALVLVSRDVISDDAWGRARAAGWTPDLEPWSKAGIIITASTRPGSAYAAMMVTGSRGVRMQWNYTGDSAGLAGNVTITGYDSADGTGWTKAGAVTLTGLPATAQAGLFAASPFRNMAISQSAIGASGISVASARLSNRK